MSIDTPEAETYLTKSNPTVEDWLEFNQPLFDALKGLQPESAPQYAPLTDVDVYAAEAGLSLEEYLLHIRERVGTLGDAMLKLVYTDMDAAWHVVVAPQQ